MVTAHSHCHSEPPREDALSPKPWLDAEEIKRQVSIEAVLTRYGLMERLRRQGGQLVGKSPFRDETKPSFTVNPERGVWNDFGGRPEVNGRPVSGDVIGLVQALEGGISFRDALLKLHEGFLMGAEGVATETRGAVMDHLVHGAAQAALRQAAVAVDRNEVFGKELGGLRADVPFLKEKGLKEETIKAWGVGYCSRGMMQGRIVFPIKNLAGEIVAYGGRALKDDDPQGKYRFPPGFRKSLELFGAHRLRHDERTRAAAEKHGLILVEGPWDAMKLDQEGYPHVVALLGSDGPHDAQKAVLFDPAINPTRRLTLFLDNDQAGQHARRAIAQALIHEAWLRYADYRHVAERKTEPEHMTAEDLKLVLGDPP